MQEYFNIADGRTHFYQWDIDREMVVLDDRITQLHYCNGTSDCSLVCEVVNGRANVPNILLQTAGNIRIYGYSDGHTEVCKIISVVPRTKPDDYVYTETEVLEWRSLEGRIEALENGAEAPAPVGWKGSGANAEIHNTTNNVASGFNAFAEGEFTKATGTASHAEGGGTEARGVRSHAEGLSTVAVGAGQHVQGEYNIIDTEPLMPSWRATYAHIVGNGKSKNARSNAHTLDWDGNAWFAGTVEGTGVILTSPNGTRYKVTIGDDGKLTASAVE